jgi:hypothetical protein
VEKRRLATTTAVGIRIGRRQRGTAEEKPAATLSVLPFFFETAASSNCVRDFPLVKRLGSVGSIWHINEREREGPTRK